MSDWILREASSISFRRSVTYGLGVVWSTLCLAMQHFGLIHFGAFDPKGRKLEWNYHELADSADPQALQTQPVRDDSAAFAEGQVRLKATSVK
jgi:hypothetical protein